MPRLKEGVKAPDFKLAGSNGKDVSLKDFKGQYIILYFYPKDDTPGCTVEACGFKDWHKKLETEDAVILGVSPDDVKKHNRFIDKFKLPFVLLADIEKKVCKSYGVWVKKSMYGREYMGVARTTFIIDKDGKIMKIYEKVKPDGHAEEIITFLKEGE